jgi:hypothetical protein
MVTQFPECVDTARDLAFPHSYIPSSNLIDPLQSRNSQQKQQQQQMQKQQIFAATDLNVSPKWEINFGMGLGSTAATDHLIVKGILGRRFNLERKSVVD